MAQMKISRRIAGILLVTIGAAAFAVFARVVPTLPFSSPALPQTVGGHALAWYECGTPAQPLSTAPVATHASGSTLLAWVSRGHIDTFTPATVPTDNKGNRFSILGAVHDYSPRWPSSGEAMYAAPSAAGGRDHVFTVQMISSDEVTFAVIEVMNGGVIHDAQWKKVTDGAPNTSGNVTTTGPATLVAVWAGDGAAPRMTVVPNNGFAIVDAQLTNTSCAIQAVIAAKEVADAGTYNVTWTATPAQGAHLWLIAVQRAP